MDSDILPNTHACYNGGTIDDTRTWMDERTITTSAFYIIGWNPNDIIILFWMLLAVVIGANILGGLEAA